MYEIKTKRLLAPQVWHLVVHAPEVARNCRAGQFVMVMAHPRGERIPLTIAGWDREEGTITLVVQVVGKTTGLIGALGAGEKLAGVAGPLGQPARVTKAGLVVGVAGGIGAAPLLPILTGLREAGSRVVTVLGARSAEMLILEEELASVSQSLIVCTDDGSKGIRGVVTGPLRELVERGAGAGAGDGGGGEGSVGEKVDLVVAIGPPPMMEACARVTRPFGVKTMVSLNSLMVDGTGMCGGCRVTVGGETKFTCVDGPQFDGHLVDFEELKGRLGFYREEETRILGGCCQKKQA